MLGEESHLPGSRGGGDEGFAAGLLQLQGVNVLGMPTSDSSKIFSSTALLLRRSAKC